MRPLVMYAGCRRDPDPRKVTGMPDEIGSTLLGSLIRALDAAPPYRLATVLHEFLNSAVGAQAATVLLADYEERTLEPVPDAVPSPTLGAQRIEGSEAGRAYREEQIVEVAIAGRRGGAVFADHAACRAGRGARGAAARRDRGGARAAQRGCPSFLRTSSRRRGATPTSSSGSAADATCNSRPKCSGNYFRCWPTGAPSTTSRAASNRPTRSAATPSTTPSHLPISPCRCPMRWVTVCGRRSWPASP